MAVDEVEPTDRQKMVLAAIRKHLREHCVPPTVRELADAIGMSSPNGVFVHLEALDKKGCIEWNRGKGKSRMIWPVGWRNAVKSLLKGLAG